MSTQHVPIAMQEAVMQACTFSAQIEDRLNLMPGDEYRKAFKKDIVLGRFRLMCRYHAWNEYGYGFRDVYEVYSTSSDKEGWVQVMGPYGVLLPPKEVREEFLRMLDDFIKEKSALEFTLEKPENEDLGEREDWWTSRELDLAGNFGIIQDRLEDAIILLRIVVNYAEQDGTIPIDILKEKISEYKYAIKKYGHGL